MARLMRKVGMVEYKEKVQEARAHSHLSHCGGGAAGLCSLNYNVNV